MSAKLCFISPFRSGLYSGSTLIPTSLLIISHNPFKVVESPQAILNKDRADAENRIKELKYDFGLDSFCMDTWRYFEKKTKHYVSRKAIWTEI